MSAAELAQRLNGRRHGRYFVCCCPAHEDRSPSLSIWDGDTAVRVKCWAGCDPCDVIAELRARGLWQERSKRRRRGNSDE